MAHILLLAALLGAAEPAPQPPPDNGAQVLGNAVGDFLLDTGQVIVRPILPKLDDLWIIAPTLVGGVVAFHYDVPLYRAVRKYVPDPHWAGRRLSYWGSWMGDGLIDVSLFAVIGALGGDSGQRVAIEGMEALTAAAVTSRVLKLVVREQRPAFDSTRKYVFQKQLISADSFPSGHTMAAFATAAVLAREFPSCAPFVYALASYVAVARVQERTHWASDVIVGAGLGILEGWAAVDVHSHHPNWIAVPVVGPDFSGVGLAGQF